MTLFEKFITLFGQSSLWEYWYGNNDWNMDVYNPEHFHWEILITNLITIVSVIIIAAIIVEDKWDRYTEDIEKISDSLTAMVISGIIAGLLILIMPVTIFGYILVLLIQITLIIMNPPKYSYLWDWITKVKIKKQKKLTKVEKYKQSLTNK